jgi:hypothetical protein
VKIRVTLQQIVEFPEHFENEAELMDYVGLDEVEDLADDMEAYDKLVEQSLSTETSLLYARLVEEK